MTEQDLVDTASSWCASHGVLMGARNDQREPLGDYVYEPAPISLHPTPFPAPAFEKAYAMSFNSVVHKVASSDWLRTAIVTAAEGDKDFTGKLLELANEVIAKGRAQDVALGIFRSDYMLHGDIPLQVELNTIASSFACLSSKVTQLHQYLNEDDTARLPDNDAAYNVAQGLALALQEYKRQRNTSTYPAVVVMVVQPGETNSCDQRDLEFLLRKEFKTQLIRRTLAELAQTASYVNDRELVLPHGTDTNVAAGVVYYRAGYTPNDYPTDTEWQGRSLVEHSAAIKCPDVFYHLAGAKKIQQALAEPGVLKSFCDSEKQEELLSSSFAGLYALGEGDDSKAVQAALANPQDYVLKPQREGGGNNLYDDEMVQALQQMPYEERGAYILMQKILPPATSGVLVRRAKVVYRGDCVCELGVFGVSLRSYKDGGILHDKIGGHILRSKSVQTDEGGVAAGYAFLSSPRLV